MRLIDADALRRRICHHLADVIYKGSGYIPSGKESASAYEFLRGYEEGARQIANMVLRDENLVDAVPVVRCKECDHRRDDEDYASGHYCVKRPSNGGYFCEDNDFCSYGERRK